MKIVIFGSGGHAKVVADSIRMGGLHEIAGLVTLDGTPGEFIPDIEVVASNENFTGKVAILGATGAVIALGDVEVRKRLAAMAKNILTLVPVVHPAATISSSASIGAGTVVMAGAVVNAHTTVGENSIINTGATVDHDCSIGNLVHVAPGCTVCGHVSIADETMLGAGTVVSDHIDIGSRVFTVAGSVVTRSIPDGHRLIAGRAVRSSSV